MGSVFPAHSHRLAAFEADSKNLPVLRSRRVRDEDQRRFRHRELAHREPARGNTRELARVERKAIDVNILVSIRKEIDRVARRRPLGLPERGDVLRLFLPVELAHGARGRRDHEDPARLHVEIGGIDEKLPIAGPAIGKDGVDRGPA